VANLINFRWKNGENKIPTNHNFFLFLEEKFAKLRKLATPPLQKNPLGHTRKKKTPSFFTLSADKARGCENKNHARN
jgi:hypothetical protein